MGITASDIELIELTRFHNPKILQVLDLGSQNLYRPGDDPNKPPFASEYYQGLGLMYKCIDMAGDNLAMKFDLSKPIPYPEKEFDLVTDFGTSEHVVSDVEMNSVAFHEGHINSVYPTSQPTEENIRRGYYECWRNKHRLLKERGFMISVNPKTGHWPGHGYTYIDKEFYYQLAKMMAYEIYWLNENEAMGNPEAVNIECVLRKIMPNDFCSFENFQTCNQFLK